MHCSICYERFTEPVALPCGHIFCRECIRRTIDTIKSPNVENVHYCPSCRTPYSVVSIDPALIPPYLLSHILPVLRPVFLDDDSTSPSNSQPTSTSLIPSAIPSLSATADSDVLQTRLGRAAAEINALRMNCATWRRRAEVHAAANVGLASFARVARDAAVRFRAERDTARNRCQLMKQRLIEVIPMSTMTMTQSPQSQASSSSDSGSASIPVDSDVDSELDLGLERDEQQLSARAAACASRKLPIFVSLQQKQQKQQQGKNQKQAPSPGQQQHASSTDSDSQSLLGPPIKRRRTCEGIPARDTSNGRAENVPVYAKLPAASSTDSGSQNLLGPPIKRRRTCEDIPAHDTSNGRAEAVPVYPMSKTAQAAPDATPLVHKAAADRGFKLQFARVQESWERTGSSTCNPVPVPNGAFRVAALASGRTSVHVAGGPQNAMPTIPMPRPIRMSA